MAKILIIDDDSSICETLEMYLAEEGYEVYSALTGTEGLNRFVETSPDVVILDIRLPDVDGFMILEDLREENGKGVSGAVYQHAGDHADRNNDPAVKKRGMPGCIHVRCFCRDP